MKKADDYYEMINVFTPYPLEGESYEEFYVDTSAERSVMNASKTIVNSLKIARNPYLKLLFMGHRGCGKSTEIQNISRQLYDRYCIVNFSIANEVEIEGIEYIDVIFTVLSQLLDFVKQKSIDIDSKIVNRLYGYWNQKKITENIQVEEYEAQSGVNAKFSFLNMISLYWKGVLKAGGESKTIIREEMIPKLNILLEMMNDLISDINQQIRKMYNKELLVIIEDFDKLELEDAKSIFVTHRRPFISLNVNMILSFPIYLVYTSDYSMIRDDFDKCVMYSMIKVQNSDRSKYKEGIAILKEIVFKRMSRALIKEEALDYMVMKSGGAIRDLFFMLSEAAFYRINQESLNEPITLDIAKQTAMILKSEYERNITSSEQYEMLKTIYKTPHPSNTGVVLSELLKTLSVIEYNGERWCGVHPVLIDFLKEKGDI